MLMPIHCLAVLVNYYHHYQNKRYAFKLVLINGFIYGDQVYNIFKCYSIVSENKISSTMLNLKKQYDDTTTAVVM